MLQCDIFWYLLQYYIFDICYSNVWHMISVTIWPLMKSQTSIRHLFTLWNLMITDTEWHFRYLFQYDIFWYLFQYLQQFGGYGACIIIGFLFIFIFPLIGLCFCCCRCCCSNCGGKMMQHNEDVKADCKRRTFAIILFVLIAFTG